MEHLFSVTIYSRLTVIFFEVESIMLSTRVATRVTLVPVYGDGIFLFT